MYPRQSSVWVVVLITFATIMNGDLAAQSPQLQSPANVELATIKKEVGTGFANAGWKYDRYRDLPSLDAGKRMIVADLKGPGIIRHIHTTRHHRPELTARGIVLEIYFDNAETPAVMCPLSDFFGDGCNGKSMFFSTPLIECAPWSYNCYIPMPFAESAKVILRNDTPHNVMNYSYVEWEPIQRWSEDLGYFYATWKRKVFQMSKDSDVEFFRVKGAGHILGRQFSVATDEPLFQNFNFAMEGNNEVDIDGRERALDYLGTEDSFTFSWGFQKTFAGLRAGMPFISQGLPSMLSIYRFHDHQPIRFRRELSWSINWSLERSFTERPQWGKRVEEGGCWVHYDTVFYWYQDAPAGYQHEVLPPLAERSLALARSSMNRVSLEKVVESAPLDDRLDLTFDSAKDMERVRWSGCYAGTHPFWIDRPDDKGGHPGNPNPGRRGILAVHAQGETVPAIVVRRVKVPAGRLHVLRLTVSGDPYEFPGRSDFVVQAGVHDGKALTWFPEQTIDAGAEPQESNWRTLEYPLDQYGDKTVSIVVKVAYGGPNKNRNEEAFFDEISIRPGKAASR